MNAVTTEKRNAQPTTQLVGSGTELIKIEENGGIETVNARELHYFLESKQDFSTWLKGRISKYGFRKEVDFTLHKYVERRATRIDYHITIDMAKELSMVENNARGREARQYFIAREKQAKALSTQLQGPALIASALIEANKMLEEVKHENHTLRIKADVADRIANADGLICMTDAGKAIGANPRKIIWWLEEEGILYRRKSTGTLLPMSVFQDRGYFDVIAETYGDKAKVRTMVTPKGLAWICAKWNKTHNLLPFPPVGA